MMSHSIGKSFPEFFETVLIPSDDDLINSELKEYFADFFLPDYYVRADIVSSKILQGVGEKFTVILILAIFSLLKGLCNPS